MSDLMTGAEVVSIHAPTRGATPRQPPARRPSPSFDPRPHAGSDVVKQWLRSGLLVFRSTPPRGERRACANRGSRQLQVSIHAPTRGATRRESVCKRHDTFRSTPPRGERRRDGRAACRRAAGFDPRPHAGSDRCGPASWAGTSSFDPRPHAGSDRLSGNQRRVGTGFDPRPHAGSDLRMDSLTVAKIGFDPRPHAGSDRRQP